MPLPLGGPPPLHLPQDEPQERKRARQLGSARDRYKYDYDKENIRDLAMLERVPAAEYPDLGWIAKVGEAAAAASINSSMLEGDEERSELDHPDHVGLVRRLTEAAHDAGAAAIDHVLQVAREGGPSGRATEIAEYARLFQYWRTPDIASEWALDAAFARARLAGSNPAWLRQVDPSLGIPDDLGVTDDHFAAAIPGPDSLAAALAEGRLFLADYRRLATTEPGSYPVPPAIDIDYRKDRSGWDAAYAAREAAYATTGTRKVPVAPLALFTVSGGAFLPVAVQLAPNGLGPTREPVFTPRDGQAWIEARTAVQCADFNVHEVVSHLGLTHVVQEAFALALHNCLAERHPLHRLLQPHFEGTFVINGAANSTLTAPGGGVDTILNTTIGGGVALTAGAVRAFDFNEAIFPNELAARGVSDPSVLPGYGYRDDGLLVWKALHAWVSDYVARWYQSEADVLADTELQEFVRQVGQWKVDDGSGDLVGGGIRGVGEAGGGVQTRAYLVTMLTQIIWNGSAQHAAVNFPQRTLMSFAPHMPGALIGPLPNSPQGRDVETLLSMLPSRPLARAQQGLTVLLGSVHHTKLGQYPVRWFGRELTEQLGSFHNALQDVERTILARNDSRPDYTYLLPSLIPQSINI